MFSFSSDREKSGDWEKEKNSVDRAEHNSHK